MPPTTIDTPLKLSKADKELTKQLSVMRKISDSLHLSQQPEVVQTASLQDYNNDTTAYPLFLVHDGSGICIQYHRLRPLQRATYALHDPKFLDPSDSWPNLGAMADHYAQIIASTGHGPYILGGWSFGGVVAFEAARTLMRLNYTVAGVVLIDSPPPINHQPLSSSIIESIMGGEKTAANKPSEIIRSLIRRSFETSASMLGAFRPRHKVDKPMPRIFMLRSNTGWRRETSSDKQDISPTEVGNAWLQDRSDPQTAISGWETLTKEKVSFVDIPGNHFEAFDAPNISAVSEAISHACSELERSFQKNPAVLK
jgi:thioesterase domain-containing protein